MNKFIISHGAAASCWLDDVFVNERTDIPHVLSSTCQGHGAHIKSPSELQRIYGKDIKILYPIRHPVDALVSYARRGFFTYPDHIQNIGGNLVAWKSYYLKYRPSRKWSIEKTLQTYVENGDEFFDIYNHVSCWNDSDINIMFLKYKNIKKNWSRVCEFLTSPQVSAIDNFQPKTHEIKPKIRQKLNNFLSKEISLYGSLDDSKTNN
jgi:hypothetical protein